MRLTLDGDPDWKFGDVLRLRHHDRKHEYLYMFVQRKPPYFSDKGGRNDRGFMALELGAPDCPYPPGGALYPCHFDHSYMGRVNASLGGLPFEENWELVDSA